MSSTAPHRALAIPELINEIFGYLGNGSNASNAQVSHQWHEIALDCLWRDVQNLHTLFSRLAPLEKTQDQTFVS